MVVGDTDDVASDFVRFDELRRARADGRAGARRPRRRRGHRLHLGYHRRPQGRGAHPPDPRLRGAPAVRPPGHARQARPRGRAGRTRHRHAGRPALPALRGATHLHDRRLGPADGPRRHGGGADLRRQRLDLLLHQPARLPRVRPRARGAHALRRAGRLAHPQRGGRAGRRARDLAGALVRLDRAPLGDGVPARRAEGEAHPHRRPAHGVGRDPHGGRGRARRRGRPARRDPQPGAGPLRRLHRRRARRRRRSTPRAGSAPATSA